jgi:peptidoglycan/xylan/chitin deacetylase (PgdA/CDA1 family)
VTPVARAAAVAAALHAGLLLALVACIDRGDPASADPSPSPPQSSASQSTSQSPSPSPSASQSPSPSPSPSPSASQSPSPSASASASQLVSTPLPIDPTSTPFFFTASFDGSQRFTGWIDSLRFARDLTRSSGKNVHFTYFINSVYFDTAKVPSTIGRAQTKAEILVRRALAQIAVNEGHEIASHGVGHHDGSTWTLQQWREELEAFHAIADGLVYAPVRDAEGRALFPRFSARPDAKPGEAASACTTDAECAGMRCADLGDAGKLCAPPCNLKKKCGAGFACGAPFFREDEDVCLPPPDFPVIVEGEELFDAKGNPRVKGTRIRLQPLAIRGFRAPYLGVNDALVEALIERGYRYDTSFAAAPGPPRTVALHRGGPQLLELGLAAWPGVRAIPMDYNYMQLKVSGERMTADYRSSLVASYEAGKLPFNIGHHFAQWEGGAYNRALEDAVRFAVAECPTEDEEKKKRCPGAVVASFREVADAVWPARPR